MSQIFEDKIRKAIRYGRLLEFRTLLQGNKDQDPLSLQDEQGYTVIHEIAYCPAADQVQVEFLRELQEFYKQRTNGDDNAVKQILREALKKVNKKDSRSPLHISAEHDRRTLIKKFLEIGVSIYTRDAYGYTPLHLASQNGHYIQISILLDAEASQITLEDNKDNQIIECRDFSGRVPLHLACRQAHETACLVLIPRYANIDVQDNEGNTPLHYSTLSQNIRIVRALLLRGAKRSILNSEQQSPWHIADYLKNDDFKNILTEDRDCLEEYNPCKIPLKPINTSKKGIMFVWWIIIFRQTTNWVVSIPLDFNYWYYWAIDLIIFLTLAFLLILCECKNPGYIEPKPDVTLMKLLETYNAEFVCPICVSRRPHRARHCNICNRCVRKFDHHCPFVYNCVGVGNYYTFIMFLFSMFIDSILTIALSILRYSGFIDIQYVFLNNYWGFFLSTINLLQTFLVLLSVFSLIIIHSGNLMYDLTTHERYSKKQQAEVQKKRQNIAARNKKSILPTEGSDTASMFLEETFNYSSMIEDVDMTENSQSQNVLGSSLLLTEIRQKERGCAGACKKENRINICLCLCCCFKQKKRALVESSLQVVQTNSINHSKNNQQNA